MDKAHVSAEEKKSRVLKGSKSEQSQPASNTNGSLVNLQKLVGNRAVQRLINPPNSEQSFELDEDTARRVEKERGGGQRLDRSVQEKMGTAMGYDFNDVHVHTSPEADALNRDLSAQAFTTGNDIYFREGAYAPNSPSGQELLAHEMTHVVQQSSGLAGGGAKMTVNAPDDEYEKKADAVAQAVTNAPGAGQMGGIQRQEIPDEEEELQTKRVQRQEMAMSTSEEEEEELQMTQVQRQEMAMSTSEEEEEDLQTKRLNK
jgi:hypothetical protein